MKFKKSKFSGTLPTGRETTSVDRYVRAYRKLAAPILKVWPEEAKYGYSYEPGLLIGRISLSAGQSIALYEALTKKKYVC